MSLKDLCCTPLLRMGCMENAHFSLASALQPPLLNPWKKPYLFELHRTEVKYLCIAEEWEKKAPASLNATLWCTRPPSFPPAPP